MLTTYIMSQMYNHGDMASNNPYPPSQNIFPLKHLIQE